MPNSIHRFAVPFDAPPNGSNPVPRRPEARPARDAGSAESDPAAPKGGPR